MSFVGLGITKSNFITVAPLTIKRANQFTCIGWIKDPQIPDSDPLVLLAVSDQSLDVMSDSAIRVEMIKEGSDYRLQFANSKSKRITRTLGIQFDRETWHFIGYVCHGEGLMSFYVDGQYLPPEDGAGSSGILYSTAWSRSSRVGGGDVWIPYLYKLGQSVSVYNWRFGAGFTIHQQWIQELMQDELPALIEEQTA